MSDVKSGVLCRSSSVLLRTRDVRLEYKICLLIFKCLHQKAPVYLTVMSDPVSASASRSHLRSAARGDLAVPRSRTTTYGQRRFSVSGPSLWNSLQLSVRDPFMTMTQFCIHLI